jgi:hypothetical protein
MMNKTNLWSIIHQFILAFHDYSHGVMTKVRAKTNEQTKSKLETW